MESSDPAAVVQVADVVLSILVPVVITIITFFLHKLVTYVERKWKFDIPDKIESRIDRVVMSAISYGEQRARKYFKENGHKWEMGEKKEAALKFGLKMADKYDLPDWAKEHFEDFIESKLGKLNMDIIEEPEED